MTRVVRLAGASFGLALICLLLSVCGLRAAQPSAPPQPKRPGPLLSLDRVFGGEFAGESLSLWHWRDDGAGTFSFEAPPESEGKDAPDRDLVFTEAESGRKETVVPAAWLRPLGCPRSLQAQDFSFSSDRSWLLVFTNGKRVWRQESQGDFWVLNLKTRALNKLGGDAEPGTLRFAKFAPDSGRVAFVHENDLYSQSLDDLRITRLTESGSPTLLNGVFDWVYEEELDLRDGFSWSPDGQRILYWETDASRVREFTLTRNTDGLYPSTTTFAYPKAGEENSAVRLGVVDVDSASTQWLAIPGDPRNHYLARASWSSNGIDVLAQQFNRAQNTNRVWLADSRTGEARSLFVERDAAWVDNENAARPFDQGRQILWLSDRDGWRRLYAVSTSTGASRLLSNAAFDVLSVAGVDEIQGWVYIIASPDNPAQRYLYRVPLSGEGAPERVTPKASGSGQHGYQIAPGGRWAVHTFSALDQPPVTDLVQLPEHRSVRWLRENKKLRENWAALRKPRFEFLKMDLGSRGALDAWAMKPPGFDPTRRYPVLFYVYGEPHGQTVQDAWGGRSHLWHCMLAQQGYVVVSVDNRGVMSPRGRDFRKAAHRQIGIQTVADQAAAARALLKRWPFLDPKRVGVWGWSGGGSMSLNAIFQYPEVYSMAMAVAPVADQRYYDTIYQERYMGLPSENPEGYRLGSPITHATKLRGDLLVAHGTGDDNVHYQGTEALINELIANRKAFTMMAYPDRTHSISEGRNTTRHLFDLLTRYLDDHLKQKRR
ncbi:MAG: S9 family peptidase [Verrucomicrobia bacterium]|nr:S9 family peptidase [Verrucomicrobiota bacterium]MBI3869149.1 S9 family peptidase [Verrucomicrobiota bacterium]